MNLSKFLPKYKLLFFETEAREAGYLKVAGVDESGRGPLAGPVVAACCQIEEGIFLKGINDCKLLTPKKRKEIVLKLKEHSKVRYGIGIVDHKTIDKINILQATNLAMQQALEQLPEEPEYILVDGSVPLTYRQIPVKKIIGGDRLSLSIAAASNIAKVTRDDLMSEFHEKYPQWSFDKHKGYGTVEHRDRIIQFGFSPIHRKSFLKAFLHSQIKNEDPSNE